MLRWLAAGNTLTTWQAWTKWRITTASQRVTELKNQRFPVVARMVRKGRARIAEYYIPAAQAARVRKALS